MTGTVQDLHSHLILVQDGARGVNPFRLRVVVADEAPGQEPHHERCTKEMRWLWNQYIWLQRGSLFNKILIEFDVTLLVNAMVN